MPIENTIKLYRITNDLTLEMEIDCEFEAPRKVSIIEISDIFKREIK